MILKLMQPKNDATANWKKLQTKELFVITIASLAVSLSWWSYRRSLSRKSIAYMPQEFIKMQSILNQKVNNVK